MGRGASGKEPAAGQGGQPSEDCIIRVPTVSASETLTQRQSSRVSGQVEL